MSKNDTFLVPINNSLHRYTIFLKVISHTLNTIMYCLYKLCSFKKTKDIPSAMLAMPLLIYLPCNQKCTNWRNH